MEPKGFITMFTRALRRSISSTRSIQSKPPHPMSLRSILILSSHLHLDHPSGLFPPGFPTKIILPRAGGVRMKITTGSRSDERIYWSYFTITLNSDSLQSLTVYDLLHFLLDHECLPSYYDEQRIPAHCLERCLSIESTLIHF
jgi:hypothetical protein